MLVYPFFKEGRWFNIFKKYFTSHFINYKTHLITWYDWQNKILHNTHCQHLFFCSLACILDASTIKLYLFISTQVKCTASTICYSSYETNVTMWISNLKSSSISIKTITPTTKFNDNCLNTWIIFCWNNCSLGLMFSWFSIAEYYIIVNGQLP